MYFDALVSGITKGDLTNPDFPNSDSWELIKY